MQKNKYIIISFILLFLIGRIFVSGNIFWNEKKSVTLHNLGNTSYENFISNGVKEISILIESQEYYKQSLAASHSIITQHNYDFVSHILVEYVGKNQTVGVDEEKQNQQKLEEYIEKLKSEQTEYQKYYNKKEEISGFQNVFDTYFEDIDRGGKRDW